jgi:hypothetical protein
VPASSSAPCRNSTFKRPNARQAGFQPVPCPLRRVQGPRSSPPTRDAAVCSTAKPFQSSAHVRTAALGQLAASQEWPRPSLRAYAPGPRMISGFLARFSTLANAPFPSANSASVSGPRPDICSRRSDRVVRPRSSQSADRSRAIVCECAHSERSLHAADCCPRSEWRPPARSRPGRD